MRSPKTARGLGPQHRVPVHHTGKKTRSMPFKGHLLWSSSPPPSSSSSSTPNPYFRRCPGDGFASLSKLVEKNDPTAAEEGWRLANDYIFSTHGVSLLVTSKSPVGDISVVTLIRTDTTLDHSQKAGPALSLSLSLFSVEPWSNQTWKSPARFHAPHAAYKHHTLSCYGLA